MLVNRVQNHGNCLLETLEHMQLDIAFDVCGVHERTVVQKRFENCVHLLCLLVGLVDVIFGQLKFDRIQFQPLLLLHQL
jgi:hypothetical protein